ncbi:MAG TPA: NeuD/PglB/VioB family sugar acetyltransferase [Bacteroidales bacterium]|nr:NeuD/PglB/VioB family sugar acetyltransferase [Bacteroidales bacterium]
MKKIAIFGAGGLGKEVACIINHINAQNLEWDFVGFFDDGKEKGLQISHFGEVLGNLGDLNSWSSPMNIIVAIGNPDTVKRLVQGITNPNITFPNIIHPEVNFVDKSSLKIGKGNVIYRGCIFSCDVTIGDFNIFNNHTALGHDVNVGSFNAFMPLTQISGETTIGNENFFGVGSVVLQRIRIGDNTRIGAGSYVMRHTKGGHLYFGNPAKIVHF